MIELEWRNPVYNEDGSFDVEFRHSGVDWMPYTVREGDGAPVNEALLSDIPASAIAAYVAPPEPAPSDIPPPRLLRWQFHAMLDLMGVREAVDAAIEAISDPTERAVARAKLNQASFFDRNDPLFAQLAPAVGLTESQIDDAWAQAAALT